MRKKIYYSEKEQIRVDEDVHQQLPHFDINNDGFLDFNEYNDKMMEIINNPETLKTLTEEEQEALRADNQRNTRRFLEADKNQVFYKTSCSRFTGLV